MERLKICNFLIINYSITISSLIIFLPQTAYLLQSEKQHKPASYEPETICKPKI